MSEALPLPVRWEYLVLRLTDHNWAAQIVELNRAGNDGWRLVMAEDGIAYLMRAKGNSG